MRIFKTFMFFSGFDEGHPFLIDTIYYKDHWWLVASWHKNKTTHKQTPARLIQMGSASVQFAEVNQPDYRFLLPNSVPKALFDGRNLTGYTTEDFLPSQSLEQFGNLH